MNSINMNVLYRLNTLLKIPSAFNRFSARLFAEMKQIHQETLRYINPLAHINIKSDIYVKVCIIDPHSYPHGNAFIAELHGGLVKNCTASMEVSISNDEKRVEVSLKKLSEFTDFHCELAIPIRASLNIDSKHGVTVKQINGDELIIKANKFINTRDIRSKHINLLCEMGDISCLGIILCHQCIIETKQEGKISLNNIKGGEEVKCKTLKGHISVNCSYANLASFESDTGSLNLKNIHKKCRVNVYKCGNLSMMGVHGNIDINLNDGCAILQLSKLFGSNTISLKGEEKESNDSSIIYLTDTIEQNTAIEANVYGKECVIDVDSDLGYLAEALSDNKQYINRQQIDGITSLKVCSRHSVIFRKSSWVQIMQKKLEQTINSPTSER